MVGVRRLHGIEVASAIVALPVQITARDVPGTSRRTRRVSVIAAKSAPKKQ